VEAQARLEAAAREAGKASSEKGLDKADDKSSAVLAE
jgi:hypothetical protein